MSKHDPKHRRRIRMSVCLPVTVELIVTTDDEPDEDADWAVESVVRADVDSPSPKFVTEQMHDVDVEAMGVMAANTEDL